MESYREFRARDFRSIARDKLSGRWGLSLAVTLVASILGAFGGGNGFSGVSSLSSSMGSMSSMGYGDASSAMQQAEEVVRDILSNPFILSFLGVMITIGMMVGLALSFVGAATQLGHCKYYVDLCNNESPNFGVLFSRFRIFWKAVGLRYFMALFIFLWTLLFWVPGIIAAYRYSMATYLMAQDPEKGIRQCVNESKELMRGHKGRLFCLDLSFIGWILLGVLSFGVGFLWINPYMQAARAAFYLDRTGQGIPLNPQQ